MESPFLEKLKAYGWAEVCFDTEYRKGNWFVIRDTSNWWIIGTINNSRVFDFPEPTDYTVPWTVNLIEHLCKTDDHISLGKCG